MNVWDSVGENVKRSTRQWVSWAREHAREIGDAGIRHIERQDLLSERQKLYGLLGEMVARKFILEDQKTLRPGSPGIDELLERIGKVNSRLEELEAEDANQQESS